MKKVFSFQVDTYSRVTGVTGVTPANNKHSLATQSKNEGVTCVTNLEVTRQKVTQVTPGLPKNVANKPAIDAEVTPVTQATHQNIVTQKIQAAVALAEKLKANRRAADLEELEKAFNAVMYAERTGNEENFAHALSGLEAIIIDYTESKAKAAA